MAKMKDKKHEVTLRVLHDRLFDKDSQPVWRICHAKQLGCVDCDSFWS